MKKHYRTSMRVLEREKRYMREHEEQKRASKSLYKRDQEIKEQQEKTLNSKREQDVDKESIRE